MHKQNSKNCHVYILKVLYDIQKHQKAKNKYKDKKEEMMGVFLKPVNLHSKKNVNSKPILQRNKKNNISKELSKEQKLTPEILGKEQLKGIKRHYSKLNIGKRFKIGKTLFWRGFFLIIFCIWVVKMIELGFYHFPQPEKDLDFIIDKNSAMDKRNGDYIAFFC